MAKEKDPFVNYTVEQIFISESMLYILQVGREVFEVDGQWFFVKATVANHYKKIFNMLVDDLKNGTPREKRRANKIMPDLRILPFRMH